MRVLWLLLITPILAMAQAAPQFRQTTFANLGVPNDNNVRYVVDGAVDPTTGNCLSGGFGAYAFRVQTGASSFVWRCSIFTPGGGGLGGGTVTSVAATAPSGFSFSGSPITSSGTLALSYASGQPANRFLATPNGSTGALSLRAIAPADFLAGTVSVNRCLRINAAGEAVVASDDCSAGGVTSVGVALPNVFSVSGSPITSAGTITATLASQAANTIFGGPTTGSAAAPTFRGLVLADIPLITEAKLSFSDVATANASASAHGLLPKLTGNGSDCLRGDGSFSTCPGAGSGGDFSTNTTTSVAQQIMVAAGTGGKLGTFATGSGVAISTAGVLGYKTNPSGAFLGDTDSQIVQNKTIDGDNNTVQDLPVTAIKTVVADANKVLQRDGSGVPVSSLTLPAVSGANLTSLNGSNIASGTIADARLSTNVSLLGQSIDLGTAEATGTIASARFPATLPSLSGVNLTSLNASNLGSGTVPTARLGSGAASSSTCLKGDSTWGTCGSGAPGGSNTQIQFNNSGVFGGASNFLFTSTTGQITANQAGNGNNVFYGKRITDSASTGNFFLFQNQAASVDLFKVDVSGNTSIGGSLTVNTSGGSNGILTISSASGGAIQLTTGTKPICDVSKRFVIWAVAGGAGVADTTEICTKNSSDVYAWRSLF